jgi:uncharacterized membrane protein
MSRLKYSLLWIAICVLAGAAARYLIGVGFWSATLIAAVALVAHGIVADWEDRGTFND